MCWEWLQGFGGSEDIQELPNSQWPTGARHTHPLRQVKRDGEDEISKPPLQTHTLLCTHQHRDVQIFHSAAPAWFPLLYAGLRHASVINEKTQRKWLYIACVFERESTRKAFMHIQMYPLFFFTMLKTALN